MEEHKKTRSILGLSWFCFLQSLGKNKGTENGFKHHTSNYFLLSPHLNLKVETLSTISKKPTNSCMNVVEHK